jgi:hypothetical protein
MTLQAYIIILLALASAISCGPLAAVGPLEETFCIKIVDIIKTTAGEINLKISPISCGPLNQYAQDYEHIIEKNLQQPVLLNKTSHELTISSLKIDANYLKIGATFFVAMTGARSKRGLPALILTPIVVTAITAAIIPIILHFRDQQFHHPYVVKEVMDDHQFDNQEYMQELKDKEYRAKKLLEEQARLKANRAIEHAPTKKQATGKQCSKSATKTSVYSLKDHALVSSQSSSAAGSGAPGPPPPPGGGKKPTPAPKLNLEKIGVAKTSKNIKKTTFIVDPRLLSAKLLTPQVQNRNNEIEVVSLDNSLEEEDLVFDDSVIIINSEYLLNALPGSSISIESPVPSTSRGCISNTASTFINVDSSSSEEDGGTIDQRHQITITLPRLRRRPDTDAYSIFDNLVYEQAWLGVMWGTRASGITNTCNMDSFLSHALYMARQYNGYFRRHLNLDNNMAENALQRLTMDTTIGSVYDISQRAHLRWSEIIPNSNFPTVNQVIDVAGAERFNVIKALTDSSIMFFVHNCHCPQETYSSSSATEEFSLTWNSARLRRLSGQTNEGKSTRKSEKKCKECHSEFIYQRGLVPASTWFHSFDLSRQEDHTNLPTTIEMFDFHTNELVNFDVGYISYSIDTGMTTAFGMLNHQVSLHYINNEWRFYDGMVANGALQNIPRHFMTKYQISSITYFRRDHQ